MSKKNFIAEIETDVDDVLQTNFQYSNTKEVPNSDTGGLSFERGVEKKGKELKTCVLYVDIRDSVALTKKHHSLTMGKIYTSFTKAVLKAAKHHDGFVRNIIGDRVMIVFPEENCFTNAVHCAITINHISNYVINEKFDVDFKCGIGVDYGKLRIIKVGLPKQGAEKYTNKNLVWVGKPANIASRLTDVANKTIKEDYYEVVRHPSNFMKHISAGLIGAMFGNSINTSKEPDFLEKTETVFQTPEEFANSISSIKDGEIYYSRGKLVKFSKKVKTTSYPSILLTEGVYNGYKSANPDRESIIRGNWKEQEGSIKDVGQKIFGCSNTWVLK